jgi:hypothetical protein
MITPIINENWCCLSEDAKPTKGVKNGQTIIEMDTGNVFIYDEKNKKWWPV